MRKHKHSGFNSPFLYLIVCVSFATLGLTAWSTAARSGKKQADSMIQRKGFEKIADLGKRLQPDKVPTGSALKDLQAQIRSLPSQEEQGCPDFNGGLESGKQRMTAIIGELLQKHEQRSRDGARESRQLESQDSLSSQLMKLVEKYETIVSH